MKLREKRLWTVKKFLYRGECGWVWSWQPRQILLLLFSNSKQWWAMRMAFSNFRKRKSVEISGSFQASENFWKFTEICGNFHPRFPQISINFRRCFKQFPKIYGKFLKMVKWVKLFCLNSCFETKHLSNSSLIFNVKKCCSNFGHVRTIFWPSWYFEIFCVWNHSNSWATRALRITM